MLDRLTINIYHKPTKTFQIVAQIDFNNQRIDTYGGNDGEPLYNIPFDECEIASILFPPVVDDEN